MAEKNPMEINNKWYGKVSTHGLDGVETERFIHPYFRFSNAGNYLYIVMYKLISWIN